MPRPQVDAGPIDLCGDAMREAPREKPHVNAEHQCSNICIILCCKSETRFSPSHTSVVLRFVFDPVTLATTWIDLLSPSCSVLCLCSLETRKRPWHIAGINVVRTLTDVAETFPGISYTFINFQGKVLASRGGSRVQVTLSLVPVVCSQSQEKAPIYFPQDTAPMTSKGMQCLLTKQGFTAN